MLLGGAVTGRYETSAPLSSFVSVHPETTQCHSERQRRISAIPVTTRFFVAKLLRMTPRSRISGWILVKNKGSSPKELASFRRVGYWSPFVANNNRSFRRRHSQTIKSFCLGDPLDFARDKLAQAKALCLSGISAVIIAERLVYLPPRPAEANICVCRAKRAANERWRD